MALFSFLKGKQKPDAPDNKGKTDRGIMVFEHTSEVIQAENILKKEGWEIRVMGPPPEIQSGCDLIIEFPLIEELNLFRTLEEEGIPPLAMVPVSSPLLQPVDLFHIKDFGEYLMVRAANILKVWSVPPNSTSACKATES